MTGLAFIFLVFVTACRPGADQDGRLVVAASTEVIADIVRNVAGDRAEVWSVVPPSGDIHNYSAAPGDVRRLAESDLLVTVGANLERFEESAAWRRTAREAGVDRLEFGKELPLIKVDKVIDHGDHVHDLREGDPHIWLDPAMVIGMVDLIAARLALIDPDGKAMYAANAASYREALLALHREIETSLAEIPVERRRILVHHDAFTYFSLRYGVEVAGFVTREDSSEPSAQDIAELYRLAGQGAIHGVFSDAGRKAAHLEPIAREAGVGVGELLSDGFAGRVNSYIEMMRFNLASLLSVLR